jgi:hypothetical protein
MHKNDADSACAWWGAYSAFVATGSFAILNPTVRSTSSAIAFIFTVYLLGVGSARAAWTVLSALNTLSLQERTKLGLEEKLQIWVQLA